MNVDKLIKMCMTKIAEDSPDPSAIPDFSVIQSGLEIWGKLYREGKIGINPLMHIVEKCLNPDVMPIFMVKGCKIDNRDESGNTALILAAGKNPQACITEELIKAGANVDLKNKSGMTALMVAASWNPTSEVVSLLLKAGAKVTDREENGKTPLLLAAAWNKKPEVITMLLDAGAEINDTDRFGWSALMYAAGFNPNPKVLELLLQAGADVNIRATVGGVTALMCATKLSKVREMIPLLLNAGADVTIKNESGLTAFNYAEENSDILNSKEYWDLYFKGEQAS